MAITGLSSWRSAPTFLSIVITSLALASHASIASAAHDGYSRVVTDHFLGLNPRSGSRFLAGNAKNGGSCNPAAGNNGCSTELLCCANQCLDVHTDKNNCGACGNKCRFGELCCKGCCTVVAYDASNCGGCGAVCKPGLRCEYGSCGYA